MVCMNGFRPVFTIFRKIRRDYLKKFINLFGVLIILLFISILEAFYGKKTAVNFNLTQVKPHVWKYNSLRWKVIETWQFISSLDTFMYTPPSCSWSVYWWAHLLWQLLAGLVHVIVFFFNFIILLFMVILNMGCLIYWIWRVNLRV